jgi:predicted transcriptional regulator
MTPKVGKNFKLRPDLTRDLEALSLALYRSQTSIVEEALDRFIPLLKENRFGRAQEQE